MIVYELKNILLVNVSKRALYMKKKNLIIFGTLPEAIKMAPLVKESLKNEFFETKVWGDIIVFLMAHEEFEGLQLGDEQVVLGFCGVNEK